MKDHFPNKNETCVFLKFWKSNFKKPFRKGDPKVNRFHTLKLPEDLWIKKWNYFIPKTFDLVLQWSSMGKESTEKEARFEVRN